MGNAAIKLHVEKQGPVTLRELTALDRLVALMKEQESRPFSADEFNKFERELGERLREVGQEALGHEMSKADIDSESILVDGVAHRRVLRGTETYMTSLGPVTVERTLYKNRADPKSKSLAAMDARLGVIGKFWLPEAAKQAAWVVSQMTPGLAQELFERVGNMKPSKSSLDRLPKVVHKRWEDNREEFESELRSVTEIPEETASIAVSIDGVLAPMKDGDAPQKRSRTASEGRLTKGPAGYREVGCATLSFCDENGEMISAIRMARMPEPKKETLKHSILAELGALLAQCPQLPVVKIADGAQDNWRFFSEHIPEGAEAIDFFHATEHLNQALGCAYGEGTRTARFRFQELREILLEEADGVEQVIRTLMYLKRKHPRKKRIAEVLAYFRKNQKRMLYFELKEAGLPIGSGAVEAACKTLVAQRLKQSGMRWGMTGGQGVLTIRGWAQSERFDYAWAMFAAAHQIQVTTIDNIIAFPTRKVASSTASV